MFRLSARKLSSSAIVSSSFTPKSRKTVSYLHDLYSRQKPISVITAWDHITGKMADEAEIDVALVGDSLAMVALGYEDTNELDLQELLYHVQAVSRGNQSSFIVADIPFGSFETSEAQALSTAITLVKKGRAQAVKMEGGAEMAPTIRKIVQAGIPVMGHVGLTPQKHNASGGYKLQGNTTDSAMQIIKDCKALQTAGVFAIVIECVPNKLTQILTSQVKVPTIGIGAGPFTSGQVLVMADMLGMNDKTPAKFVKQYRQFFQEGRNALVEYRKDLDDGTFPNAEEHGYKMKSAVLQSVGDFVIADGKK